MSFQQSALDGVDPSYHYHKSMSEGLTRLVVELSVYCRFRKPKPFSSWVILWMCRRIRVRFDGCVAEEAVDVAYVVVSW